MRLRDYLAQPTVDMAALAARLDGLDAATRVREVRTLGKREQARLFDAAAGFRALDLAHFVPAGTPPLATVRHYGRNSLAVANRFEKRFCRPEGSGTELWGYNEHAGRWLTGPGYFVARPVEGGEVDLDYFTLPPGKPSDWPPILPNAARLGRFIYDHTRDRMRSVSAHVAIGRDVRDGKPLDVWFVLCRAGD
jgi:hypothetical protein